MSSQSQEFFKGLARGTLAVFPVLIFSEVIRAGFVSTWIPLWAIFIAPVFIALALQEGGRLSFLWRLCLLVEYVGIGALLLFRIVQTQGLLLVALLTGFIFAVYMVLDVSARKS